MSGPRREVAALRSEIRHWRRGRADTRLRDALQDAYIAVFSTLVLGAMVGNVVLQTRLLLVDECGDDGCRTALTALPWAGALVVLLAASGVARLFGPVFVTPAVASWLMPSPLDRGAVLGPRLAVVVGVAALGSALVVVPALLAGLAPGAVATTVVVVVLLGTAVVSYAALAQSRPRVPGPLLTGVLAVAAWLALLGIALRRVPDVAPPRLLAPAGLATVAVALAVAVAALVLARRGLRDVRTRDVAAGGSLAPGLSGALASLDPALAFDVLLGHRWRGRRVRARRGGPSGPWALAWTDLVRVLRSPRLVLTPVAVVVVPYAVASSGGARVVLPTLVLTLFLAGLPLLGGLRVLSRTPGIARSLPFSPTAARGAAASVPIAVLLLVALAGTPALASALDVDAATAVWCALACGLGGATAGVRLVCGAPPDYAQPLVSTPAGAVPTNLYAGLVRGTDVVLLTSLPMLLSPTPAGANVSVVLSVGVLSLLFGRR